MPRHVRWLGYAGPSTTTKPRHRGESDDGANTPHTLKMGGTMDVDKVSPCCHAEPELVHQRCTSEFWGTEVTERWTELQCSECNNLVEADHLLERWELEGPEPATAGADLGFDLED